MPNASRNTASTDDAVKLGPRSPTWRQMAIQSNPRKARLTGLTDIKPFLGCVIHRKDGPFVYQARHLLEDLDSVANFSNHHKGLSLKPVERLPDDVHEIWTLMDHMTECLNGDTAAVDPLPRIHRREWWWRWNGTCQGWRGDHPGGWHQ